MVTQRGTTITNGNNSDDNEALAEMCVVMEELWRSNQILQENILALRERHQEDV